MSKIKLILYVLCGLLGGTAFSESPASPYSYVSAIPGSASYFIMIPGKTPTLGSGIAYGVKDDGTSVKLWTVDGWYAYPDNLWFSAGGRYLVRSIDITESVARNADFEKSVAITVVRNGNILKEYKFSDLLKDLQKEVKDISVDERKNFIFRANNSPEIVTTQTLTRQLREGGLEDEAGRFFKRYVENREFFVMRTFDKTVLIIDLESGEIAFRGAFPRK